jgi:hypothetical protein
MKGIAGFFSRFFNPVNKNAAPPAPPFDPAAMARMVASAEEREIDCGQAFELMHRYAELVEQGKDGSALLPLVKRHIDICGDCREELEALLRAIQVKA